MNAYKMFLVLVAVLWTAIGIVTGAPVFAFLVALVLAFVLTLIICEAKS